MLKHIHQFESFKPIQTYEWFGICFVKKHIVIDECKDLKYFNENINIENIWYENTGTVTR